MLTQRQVLPRATPREIVRTLEHPNFKTFQGLYEAVLHQLREVVVSLTQIILINNLSMVLQLMHLPPQTHHPMFQSCQGV